MATGDELDAFFAHCPAPFFIADEEGALRKLSRPLARLLGPEVREGMRLIERVHHGDRAALDAAWVTLRDGAPHVSFKFRLREAEGGHRLVCCTASKAEGSGDIHGWLQVLTIDHSPEKDALQAQLLRLIERHVPVSIAAVDHEGVYFYMEGKGIERAGVNASRMLGKSMFKMVKDEEANQQLKRALGGECVHTMAETAGTSWDNWFIPVPDERGEIVAAMGLSFELSEAKRAEKEILEKVALIERQNQVILSLSAPIIEVWDKVLVLPMVGVMDSARAAEVTESMLAEVSRKGARFAILDVTGLEAVDTGTASHLLKMTGALRLLGAEGVITGIQPVVAQTMVALGMDLDHLVTLANLRGALGYCMKRLREGSPR